ncbi:hypothetical protein ACP70R_042281 [Stipagrostis hirtigluma subsp. patula]
MPVQEHASCHGSFDNWLFLMQPDGGCSLMNPFSNATLRLPKLATVWRRDWFNANVGFNPLFYKLLVPSPLDLSPDSLVVVLISDDGNGCTVCICQPPIATDLYKGRSGELLDYLDEVEFFEGKLYGTAADKLLILEIDDGTQNKPNISSVQCLIDSTDHFGSHPPHLSAEEGYMIRNYLVKCGGRLLMVERWIRNIHRDRATGHDDFEHHRTAGFLVFEADLSTNPGRWKSISKLGGQALFVGQHCSKSFPAGEWNGIQEDCIYFMCDYPLPDWGADPLRDSGVYNLTNGSIAPFLLETAAVPPHHGGQWRPTWFFPAEAV